MWIASASTWAFSPSKASLKTGRLDRGENPAKGVMRSYAMQQIQEGLKPFQLGIAKLRDIGPTVRSADDGTNGNHDHGRQ
jgi:hypothetical protein